MIAVEKGRKGDGNLNKRVYRQGAVCYTEFWEADEQVLPSKRHRAVGNESGQTSYLERFNCTLAQESLHC